MELKKLRPHYSSLVSWAVFLTTFVIVIITLTSAAFPNLLLKSFGGIDDHLGIEPFEAGIWAYPLLLTNVVIFGLVILHLKKRLPTQLTGFFKFILNFEISPKIAFFVVTILIGIYISFSVSEVFDGNFQADYYERVRSWLENFEATKIGNEGLFYHFPMLLGVSSLQIFGSYKAIPLIASISLLVLTYFTTVEISKKRFAGVIAMFIVMQSGLFLHYDTSITYPNFWILFYLLSLFLIYKKPLLSPISYIVSIFSKVMTVIFLPMTLFFIYRANISKQKKIRVVIFYAIAIIIGIIFLLITNTSLAENRGFDAHDFWGGFNAIHSALRLDGLVVLFILPLIVGLFLTSKRGVKEADSILFLILGMILSAPLLTAFLDASNIPYRFVPLVVFFAMGVGTLLSKKKICGIMK